MAGKGGRGLSLRTQWLFLISGVIAAGTVACVALVLQAQREVAFEHARRVVVARAETTADAVAPALQRGDRDAAREGVARLADLPAVISATLRDSAGRRIAAYEPARARGVIGDRETVRTGQPVVVEGKRAGLLEVVAEVDTFSAAQAQLLGRLSTACTALVILCGLLGLRLQSRVAGPLDVLVRAMQRVGDEGSLRQRLPVEGSGELRVVYEQFNDMLDQLESRGRDRDRTQRWLSHLIEALPDRVFVFARDGREMQVLERGEGSGRTPSRAPTGVSVDELLPGPAAASVRNAIEAVARTGERAQVDYDIPDAGEGAGAQHFEADFTALDAPDQADGLVLMVARDVTDRRRLQAQFLGSQKMEAVGQLAGGVAHDFNNLLGGIVGYAELLKRGGDPSRAADQILQTSQRAADLVRQLLAFSRRTPARHEPTDLNALVARVQGILSHTLDPRIDVVVDVADGPCTVLGDPSQLESALLNLALNARDAMPDGGTLRIATRSRQLDADEAQGLAPGLSAGRYVELSVVDSGTGIDDETRARIFEPFFTTKEAGKGTGLGLAAVYGTASSHKGVIAVDSERGLGSTFRLVLPQVSPREGSRPPVVDLVPEGSGRLMLVDDEESVRSTAEALLSTLGYRVEAFERPLDAVRYFEAHHGELDGVILDMVMPQMSGAAVAERLRGIDPGVRVLITSGYTSGDGSYATDLPLLRKPFSLPELASAVAELLDPSPRPAARAGA